ncbi:hypothetical protein BKA62DRAFT_629309, partial [Auriculariales sp. MPI-PUGE-AT-0066]
MSEWALENECGSHTGARCGSGLPEADARILALSLGLPPSRYPRRLPSPSRAPHLASVPTVARSPPARLPSPSRAPLRASPSPSRAPLPHVSPRRRTLSISHVRAHRHARFARLRCTASVASARRTSSNHRIEYLAEVCNAALVPLHELRDTEGETFDSVVFMNDILPCVDDLLELIWQSRK